jgi:imidazolonepropionase-like amidohydrolase
LVERKACVVLDRLSPDDRIARLELPSRLAQAGVPFCFGGPPAQLRLCAALAIRHGLDRRSALAALTRTPAQLLDQAASLGALREGCAADFAVWSGDPLDLSSRHLATWLDGVCAFGAQPTPGKASEPTTAAAAAGGR